MDFLKEFLKNIIERTPLVFLVVGGAFFATGATGGWPAIHVVVDEEPWRIVLGMLGVVLIGVAVLMALREQPEPTIDCKAYDISITSPQDNEVLSPPISMSGRCKALPKGFELWVFSISGSGTGARYWPTDSSEVKAETWSVKAFPGSWKSGDRRKYGVFLVGPNGQALVNYFRTAGHAMSAAGVSWPGIPELTRDIVRCGPAREITLK